MEEEITSELVILGCREACEKIQLVADILLLRTNLPLSLADPSSQATLCVESGSYSKSRDAIIANTKGLAISIKQLTHLLNNQKYGAVYKVVHTITNQVVLLIEAAACAAYLTSLADIRCQPAIPGAVDYYRLECARQAIQMCYEKFKPHYKIFHSQQQILSVSQILADSIAVFTYGCKQASENQHISRLDRAQFANCIQCLQGVTATFIGSLNILASSQTEEDCEHCLLFGKPLLAAVDMIADFAKFPQFQGTPSILTQRGFECQTEILGGAMAVVSSTVQLIEVTKSIIEDFTSVSVWQKFANCSKAVAEASKRLSSSIREHSPILSRRSSTDQM